MVYLVTGKKDAGKTHYALMFAKELHDEGYKVRVLDGDEYREKQGTTNPEDFTDEGRIKNLRGLAVLAQEQEAEGCVVIVACVSPRCEWRNMMRQYWVKSRVIYLPGGTLWAGTTYERPEEWEMDVKAGSMIINNTV